MAHWQAGVKADTVQQRTLRLCKEGRRVWKKKKVCLKLKISQSNTVCEIYTVSHFHWY